MDAARNVDTGRLLLVPVSFGEIENLIRLKGDPLVYGQMLGGVCPPAKVMAELAEDVAFWAKYGVGMWVVHERASNEAVGMVGLHERPDGRGIGLRFAFDPASRGRGLAREAAGAALRYAHERAGLKRVVAVAKESNIASRQVLGAIGMVECESFPRGGDRMMVFESVYPRVYRRPLNP